MKTFKLVIAVFITLFCFITTFAQGIKFTEGNWESIKEKAKQENKLIMVDVFTEWCGPCKWMASTIFPNDTVGKFYNENFICWSIDAEKGEGPDFAKEYKVAGYPTFIFADGTGKLMHKIIGARPKAGDFVRAGETALNPELRIANYIDRYEKGERSLDFLGKYILALNGGGEQPVSAVNEYFEKQNENEWISKENCNIIMSNIYSLDKKVFEFFLKNIEKYYSFDINKQYIEQSIYFYYANNMRMQSANWQEKDLLDFFENIKKTGYKNYDKLSLQLKTDYYLRVNIDKDKYAKYSIEYVEKFIDYSDKDKCCCDLNDWAWSFYENVTDKKQLKKAIEWSQKSLEIDQRYNFLDTYAALNYKAGNKEEAKKYAELAIKKAKETGEDSSETVKLLEKIKLMK